MKKYNIKGKKIEPYNIVCAITSEPDYEMTRIILLEDVLDQYGLGKRESPFIISEI